jgi:hypothetical protein
MVLAGPMEIAGSLSPSGLNSGVFVNVKLPGIVTAPAISATRTTAPTTFIALRVRRIDMGVLLSRTKPNDRPVRCGPGLIRLLTRSRNCFRRTESTAYNVKFMESTYRRSVAGCARSSASAKHSVPSVAAASLDGAALPRPVNCGTVGSNMRLGKKEPRALPDPTAACPCNTLHVSCKNSHIDNCIHGEQHSFVLRPNLASPRLPAGLPRR